MNTRNAEKVHEKLYSEKLKDVVETPFIPEGYLSCFAQYTIKLNSKKERERKEIQENNGNEMSSLSM